MLIRAYRLSDRLGVVVLKTSAGFGLLILESITSIAQSTQQGTSGVARVLVVVIGAIIAVLGAVFGFILATLTRIVLLVLSILSRVTGVTANVAQATASGAMARRSARTEMEVGLAEDPLRVQNRILSVIVVAVLIALIGVVLWATSNNPNAEPVAIAQSNLALNTDGVSETAGDTTAPEDAEPNQFGLATPVPTATNLPQVLEARGSLVYTVREQGQTDLWVSPVDTLTRLRITNSPGDERDAAWHPEGTQIAYASNKDGNWDLYIYDLETNQTRQMTLNLGFEGGPKWSPDGTFLVYEGYQQTTHLDLFVMRADGTEAPSRLPASSDAPDFSPAWSPGGRHIAFTSWRDGNQDIYVFSLDTGEVTNITNTPDRQEDYPAWSPDGELLAFSAREAGLETVFVKPFDEPNSEAQVFRLGRMPTWSPDGTSMAFMVDTSADSRIIAAPYTETGVTTEVLQVSLGSSKPDWTSTPLPTALVNSGGLEFGVEQPLFIEQVSAEQPPYGLGTMIGIENIDRPLLNERVNDSFNALRVRVNQRAGWDFLGNISDALWDLNYRPQPGEPRRNWHLTGRAFSFNRELIVGFPPMVEIVREEGEVATFWRVYVRVVDEAQNGQLGEPLRQIPWDFAAATRDDVDAYDQGGRLRATMPEGYYIDLTQIAADYGWMRTAAGSDWRNNFNVRNYWQFQKRENLTWYDAMLELYNESQLGGFVPTSTPLPPTLPPVGTPEGDTQ